MCFRWGILAGFAALGLGFSAQLLAAEEGSGGTGGTTPPPPSPTDYFRKLDLNGDGQLSVQEFTRGKDVSNTFTNWDTNGDHFLSLDEFLTGMKKVTGGTPPPNLPPPTPTDYFRQLDKNGDGQLSMEEFTRGNKTESIFVSWDTNGDHFLSLDEFLAGIKKGTGGTTPPKSPQPVTSPTDYFRQLDKNGDGQLSMEEFTRGNKTESIFVSWDTNSDHFLSLDEFLAGIKKGTGGTVGATPPTSPSEPGSWGPVTNGTGIGSGKTGKADTGRKAIRITPDEYFQKLDINGDGKLSLDEFTGKRAKSSTIETLFVTWDKDADHFLSPSEFSAGLKKRK